MPRALLASLAAVALLLAGSLGAISWATRGDAVAFPDSVVEAPLVATLPAPPPPAPAPSAALPAADLIVPPLAVVPLPAAPPAAPSRRPAPARTSQQRAPAADRAGLWSFRRELKTGFAALERRVAPCALANASLTLSVETVAGGLRIVDAAAAAGAASSGADLACAQEALRGQVIPAPSAAPGRRWEVAFRPRPTAS